MKLHDYQFVANPDSLHCTQASFIMAIEALDGSRISMEQAEALTGFEPGVETWPYAMIATFAEQGYEVRHVDAIDPVALTNNPEQALRASGLDEETLAYFVQITDFEQEKRNVERALATGNVHFDVRKPVVDEIAQVLDDGWLPLVSLDAAVLDGRSYEEFEGHVVVVRGQKGKKLVIDDPGPPARPMWAVSLEVMSAALRSPAETSGTITYIRRQSK